MALWLSFVLIVIFPFLSGLLGALIRDKDTSEMSKFFTTCIQKLIKQRDELPPSQVQYNLGEIIKKNSNACS